MASYCLFILLQGGKLRIFSVLQLLQFFILLIGEAPCLHYKHAGDDGGENVDNSKCKEAGGDAKAAIDHCGEMSGEEDRDKVAEGTGCVHKSLFISYRIK